MHKYAYLDAYTYDVQDKYTLLGININGILYFSNFHAVIQEF